ncbi:mCG1026314 [Mus musculus]|nr:mCG1026314 [Mus musculus]
MLRACPSSAFTWEPATQFPFVVVLGWFLHLKGSGKLERPMIELQPAEQTMPQPNWPLPGFLQPCTPLSTEGNLGTARTNGARKQGGFSCFHYRQSCKAHK